MKPILVACITCVLITSPAHSELTPADLGKIRLLVKEEVAKSVEASETRMKQYIDLKIENVETQIKEVETQIKRAETQIKGVNDRVSLAVNLTYGLIALIVAAVGIPQIIMVWRSRSDSALERRMETLVDKIEEMAADIETLKQQRSTRP